MKAVRLVVLFSVGFLASSCRTPATRTVMHRPFSEVKAAILDFVKSHEESDRAVPTTPRLLTLGTNTLDMGRYFAHTTNQQNSPPRAVSPHFKAEMDISSPAVAREPKFQIVEMVENTPRFKITFLWLQPLNSFGHDWVEIKAEPKGTEYTRLSIHASQSGPPNWSSRRIFRNEYRETETLLRLCHSLKYSP